MLKRATVFFVFLCLMLIVFAQSTQLPLYYYVLSSLLIFPIYYLFEQRDKYFLLAAICSALLFEFLHLFFARQIEFLLLILMHIMLLACLIIYRKYWEKRLRHETLHNERLLQEWEGLKEKHQLRLENLHNLEKQASSLMDLFEIARDFSECLSFPSLVDSLHKKVLPELPFQRMRLVLGEGGEENVSEERFYTISESGIEEGKSNLSDAEKELIREAAQAKEMHRSKDLWVFPLNIHSALTAYLIVEGANPNDLAKFEVLAAHLVLQIKKIRLYETVRELSIVDGLTQVFVRRHFMELFIEELNRSIKHKLSLALLMLDIDHFKRYNDEFGHLVGDATLKEVASILRSSLRKVDVVARYGGEEFIVLIPETSAKGAREVAERIRSGVARHLFKVYDVTTRVTTSLGISVFPADVAKKYHQSYHQELPFELIRKSDKALYRAKDEGRNRVITYEEVKE